MKTKILTLLGQAAGYLSGQELCEQLGISRTAVWKWIRKLQEEGYEIQAVPNRGYRLVARPDVVTREACLSRMETIWAGQNLQFYAVTDSTNTRARQLAEEGAPHGTLVVAEEQTAGKGRRGRGWISPPGEAIYMTLLLRPEIGVQHASALTLVMAMAVEAGIRTVTGLNTAIKWPNDVVAEGKKLCGILTEMSTDMDGICYVVIGVGINANQSRFPEELPSAASLRMLTGSPICRSQLIAACMKAFEEYYEIFVKTEDLSGLKVQYESRLANMNQPVRVLAEAPWNGTARGIDSQGELLVEDETGQVQTVRSGEVSVRGIYGYV